MHLKSWLQDTLFIIQSAVLAAMVVAWTFSTKPSDVYRRIDVMEGRLIQRVGAYTQRVEAAQQSVESIELWAKETTATIAAMKARIDEHELRVRKEGE